MATGHQTRRRRALRAAAGALALLVGAATAPVGCDGDGAPRTSRARDQEAAGGDLGAVRERGVLRILVLRGAQGYLPRSGSPLDEERRLAADLARELGLEPELVAVDGLDELIPALLEGRGDLIADNFTVTPGRRRRVAFSTPIATVSELAVVAADAEEVDDPSDLEGLRLGVRRASSFWETAEALRSEHPDIELVEAPDRMESAELLDAVARGDFDATLADSNLVRAALQWRDDIRVAFDLGEPRLIAWAVRPDAVELRRAVDHHLARLAAGRDADGRSTGDLAAIRERGVLRVLTRNSATTYFVWRGQLMGFEYELAREFASRHDLRLQMIVPPSRDDLLAWLRDGRGDLVAANLTATPSRAHDEGVAFSRNYLGAEETVVVRSDEEVDELSDLRGRTLVVRRSSSYWRTLAPLAEEVGFALEPAAEELETEALIARVASGEIDVTVADSHILGVELAFRDDVKGAFALGEPVAHGWAVRPDNPELLTAVDAFFTEEFRGLFYNVLVKKYFEDRSRVQRHGKDRARGGRLSPFDELVRRYAGRYGFDWRLIAAQMHQESRFDPGARSFAGARGLMQVLPRTAREFGFEQLDDPETGIHAGVRYLAWLRERFPPAERPGERLWLTLAAYNAGYGHVRDAQRLARERGWDAERWFDNVERAMLLKEDPEIYEHTRFGYVRGREPVKYVRSIRDRYEAYVRVAAPAAGEQESDAGAVAAR